MKAYDCCKDALKTAINGLQEAYVKTVRTIRLNGKDYQTDGNTGIVDLGTTVQTASEVPMSDGRDVQTAVDAIEDEIGDDDTAGSLRQYADRAVIRVGASSGPSKYNNFPIMTVRYDTNASDNHNANLFFIGKGLDSQMKIVSGNSYPELINTGIIDFLVSTRINGDKTIIELDGYDNTDFTSVKRSATILTVGNGLALTTDGTKTLSNSGVTSVNGDTGDATVYVGAYTEDGILYVASIINNKMQTKHAYQALIPGDGLAFDSNVDRQLNNTGVLSVNGQTGNVTLESGLQSVVVDEIADSATITLKNGDAIKILTSGSLSMNAGGIANSIVLSTKSVIPQFVVVPTTNSSTDLNLTITDNTAVTADMNRYYNTTNLSLRQDGSAYCFYYDAIQQETIPSQTLYNTGIKINEIDNWSQKLLQALGNTIGTSKQLNLFNPIFVDWYFYINNVFTNRLDGYTLRIRQDDQNAITIDWFGNPPSDDVTIFIMASDAPTIGNLDINFGFSTDSVGYFSI